jgi:hypothetical protein
MPRRRLPHFTPVAGLVLATTLLIGSGLAAAACGGSGQDDSGEAPEPAATVTAPAAKSPEPVSSLPPLLRMGETARFQTPDGAVVRVRASGYADPGAAPPGVSADAGERLVTLELSVTAEDAAVTLPFGETGAFLLIAQDDTISAAKLGDGALLGRTLTPGESIGATLAFSVGPAAQLRFVCMPAEGSRPRSATWELD